jgi:hypothetical protein
VNPWYREIVIFLIHPFSIFHELLVVNHSHEIPLSLQKE